jgi:hypothetical protein
MIVQTSSSRHSQLEMGVLFLANNARCPEKPRKLLLNWSESLSYDEGTAFDVRTLEGVIDALVTLSHTNAAFSRPMAPSFYTKSTGFDIEDTGGYFAGRHAIATLIRQAPITDEEQVLLAELALGRIDRDMQALEKLLPI